MRRLYCPRLERLEDRVQLGDTILGLAVVALAGLNEPSLDAPLSADPSSADREGHARLFFSAETVGSWPPAPLQLDSQPAEAGSSPRTTRAVTPTQIVTESALPNSLADGTLAKQLAIHRLAHVLPLSSPAVSAAPGMASVGSGTAALAPGTTSSVALAGNSNAAGQAAQLLSAAPALSFNRSTGQLSIRPGVGEHTVREASRPNGFVDVMLDGQDHSSNPSSVFFDTTLVGATSATVTGIWLDGSDPVTLTVGSQQQGGSLTVQAKGATVITENVVTDSPLVIQAANITVSGAMQGSSVWLAASGWVNVNAAGQIDAVQANVGGSIMVAAGAFVNSGQLHADGATGGQISVQAGNILNAGPVTANATGPNGSGGQVQIAFTGSYIATTAAVISASNASGPAGHLTIDGGSTGRLYSSGRHLATGLLGGAVDLFSREVVLSDATVDASGATGGGNVRIGNESSTVTVTPASAIRADALRNGNGGRVTLSAEGTLTFAGTASARGGHEGGSGGFIEVSGRGDLSYAGSADAGAPSGKPGTLRLDPKNITISAAPAGVFPQFDLIDPYPTAGGHFGVGISATSVLSNGNIVVINDKADFGGDGSGAAYLFNGLTGALISALVGGGINGVGALNNGNYVVGSRLGATWGSGNMGVSGVVSAANTLLGGEWVIPLNNGNYVVANPSWSSGRGAVTWANGSTGISGTVSAANSLVGTAPGDEIGYAVVPLKNGNYVISSPTWNGDRGAATWGDGSNAQSGPVDASNSLIGSHPDDFISGFVVIDHGVHLLSAGAVTALPNGNYLVESPQWAGLGAVTWEDGSAPVSDVVSTMNSLVPGGVVSVLANSNYVVTNKSWNNYRGAATWGSGTAGVSGPVSAANSLVGTDPGDQVAGSIPGTGVTPLPNGNYVITSPNWNGNRGAATWADGNTGISGTISDANSLVGGNPNDEVGQYSFSARNVTVLSSSNYVVSTPYWNGDYGAATWGSGTAGITGVISADNSLVGSHPNDFVGASVSPLSNGNYVVQNYHWNGNRGAVTWGSGASGVTGTVSEANSLVGSNPGSGFGSDTGDEIGAVTPLSSGNYVISSPYWNHFRGEATWASGMQGMSGIVSDANSLVGANPGNGPGFPNPGDEVSQSGVVNLRNGNYVVQSKFWNGNRGAATWGSGTVGITGTVDARNSLVGTSPNDAVAGTVVALDNGNYVVESQAWNGFRGAITWEDGSTGTSGSVSTANSFVGTKDPDLSSIGILQLSSGDYLLTSPLWNGASGAVTWFSGTTGQNMDGASTITPQNSLVGQGTSFRLDNVREMPRYQSFLVSFDSGTGRVTIGLVDPNQFSYARARTQSLTITSDFLTRTLNSGTAVVLQASNDITVNSPIPTSAGGNGGALTLEAGRSIMLNAPISTDNGPLTLIANDQRANGVVDSERDAGNALITMASGTALNTGSAALTVELQDGAGLTNSDSGAITLQTITAGSVSVSNNGPSTDSDILLGPVTTNGAQTYSDRNGSTIVTANLTATDAPITFTDAVVVNDGITVDAGASTVNFAGSGTQRLQTGAGTIFTTLNHTGTGTLQLTSGLTVTGTFLNSAGIFDANDQAVTVAGLATVAGGTYLAGTAAQSFGGGLFLAGGLFNSSSGPLTVNGPIVVLGGQLNAAGTVGPVTVLSGAVTPGGSTPGVLSVAGSATFFASSILSILYSGPMPGSDYGQLQTSGPITLANSLLNLVLGSQPLVGSSFEILTNTGSLPIVGTFSGLKEGAIFNQGGYQFQITYHGGTGGNSILLTRVA